MELFARLFGLLLLLLVGTGLRQVGVLDADRTARLNTVAYYIALPALVFTATYDRNIAGIVTPSLVVGVVSVLLSTAGLAWLITRRRNAPARRSVALIQSYHSNLGYLGLPLVAATFDGAVTAVASVVLGIGSLVQVPITVVALVSINGAETRLADQLAELGRNPVLLALVAGIVIGSLGLPVAQPAVAVLDVLAALALPLALLCVGATLQVDRAAVDWGATGSVIGLKLVVMPAFAWVAFSALGVGASTFTAAVVMLGTPTAVSTYVFASELGGDSQFASLNVFATTVASLASLFVLISLVS
ncbi:MAG: AEC family transporter [Halohasta sp.]